MLTLNKDHALVSFEQRVSAQSALTEQRPMMQHKLSLNMITDAAEASNTSETTSKSQSHAKTMKPSTLQSALDRQRAAALAALQRRQQSTPSPQPR